MCDNTVVRCSFWLVLFVLCTSCATTVPQKEYIESSVRQINGRDQEFATAFRDSAISFDVQCVPVLLESYKYATDFYAYTVVARVVAGIGERSAADVYKELADFYWHHDEAQAKILSVFTYMNLYHKVRNYNTETALQHDHIVPVLIDMTRSTDIELGNSAGSLSALAAGILELYAGHAVAEILHPPHKKLLAGKKRDEEQPVYEQLRAWYESVGSTLKWDSSTGQFVPAP